MFIRAHNGLREGPGSADTGQSPPRPYFMPGRAAPYQELLDLSGLGLATSEAVREWDQRPRLKIVGGLDIDWDHGPD